MAEIHIQKKRPPIWPWILIIAAVLIAAFLLIENTRIDEEIAGGIRDDDTEIDRDINENRNNNRNNISRDRSQSSAMVNDYILFINNEEPSTDENNSDYITEGVKKLSRAIAAIADEKHQTDSEITSRADRLQQRTDTLKNISDNPEEMKELLNNSVEIMTLLQKKSNQNIDGEISEVKESAGKIRTDRSAAKQQKEMETFFKESGEVLQILASDEDINNNRY